MILAITRFEFAGPPGPVQPHNLALVGTIRSPLFTDTPKTSLACAAVSREHASSGDAAKAVPAPPKTKTSKVERKSAVADLDFIQPSSLFSNTHQLLAAIAPMIAKKNDS
jgi:hypothetical protein